MDEQTIKSAAFYIEGTPEQVSTLYAAMALAKSGFGKITKDVTGQTGNQKYQYAPLVNLIEATQPALSAQGLCIMQPLIIEGNTGTIQTRLSHKDGAVLVSCISFTIAGTLKDIGGQRTYLARYAYQSLLTLDGETDVDSVDHTKGPDIRPDQRATPPKPAQQRQAPAQQAPQQRAQPAPQLPAELREPAPATRPAPQQAQAPAQRPTEPPPAQQAPQQRPSEPPPAQAAFGLEEPAQAPQSRVEMDCTNEQNQAIRDLLVKLGMRSDAAVNLLRETTGVQSPPDLKFDSANVFIAELEKRARAAGKV
jgi:hypothetical protein